jgi:hypothetical protein
MKPSPATALLFVAVAGCAERENARPADDAGVVWRASVKERDRARTLATGRGLPDGGPHAASSDAALVLGAETALSPVNTEGAVAIAAIEGGNGGDARPVLRGPERAEGSSVSVDYASIPLVEDGPANAGDEGASFRLGRKNVSLPCRAPHPPRSVLVWAPVNWTSPGSLRVLDETLPVVVDEAIPGPPFVFRSRDRQPFRATWVVLDDARRTAGAAPLGLFEGTFDGQTAGVAKTVAKVATSALVPGVLYAYRRCVGGCSSDEADGPRRERVGLIGPRSIWRGSSASTREQPKSSDDLLPFTEVTALVGPGLSASLLIVATGDAVARFRRPLSTGSDSPIHTFSLEVVWPQAGDPDATLFSGTLDKPPPEVNPLVIEEERECAAAPLALRNEF